MGQIKKLKILIGLDGFILQNVVADLFYFYALEKSCKSREFPYPVGFLWSATILCSLKPFTPVWVFCTNSAVLISYLYIAQTSCQTFLLRKKSDFFGYYTSLLSFWQKWHDWAGANTFLKNTCLSFNINIDGNEKGVR